MQGDVDVIDEIVPVGTVVVYCNYLTRFETPEFNGQFVALTKNETARLKVGQTVYINLDCLFPRGRVFGRLKFTIISVDKHVRPNGKNELRIKYYCPKVLSRYPYGSVFITRITEDGICDGVERAVDEEMLARTLARLPLSQVLFPPRK